jgi:hypothetical protein
MEHLLDTREVGLNEPLAKPIAAPDPEDQECGTCGEEIAAAVDRKRDEPSFEHRVTSCAPQRTDGADSFSRTSSMIPAPTVAGCCSEPASVQVVSCTRARARRKALAIVALHEIVAYEPEL